MTLFTSSGQQIDLAAESVRIRHHQPESKGEEVVSKLNGTDFMGRNIKVDVSKPQNRDNKGRSGGNSGGKSARELRALAEEEEDAKKKKRRRPRKE
ncbi:MAG: hypothetical protein CM15mP71_0710 [Candidatus Poseidoniales archaeon]|nr:MAG: hypothetical protein CM15mP71_0710 [Candidatus Poseidoniales archaeon]